MIAFASEGPIERRLAPPSIAMPKASFMSACCANSTKIPISSLTAPVCG